MSLAHAAHHLRSVQLVGMLKVTAADVFRLKATMSRSHLNGPTLRLFTINRPLRTGKLAKHSPESQKVPLTTALYYKAGGAPW